VALTSSSSGHGMASSRSGHSEQQLSVEQLEIHVTRLEKLRGNFYLANTCNKTKVHTVSHLFAQRFSRKSIVFITTALEPVTKEPISMVMTLFYLTRMLCNLVIDRKAIFVYVFQQSIRGYGTSSSANFAHYYSCQAAK